MNGNCIENNCMSWYDGCNRCMVRNGQINGCTRMFCMKQHQGKAHCMGYEKGNKLLKVGDICYRFCEDNSQNPINRRRDCPAGTTCSSTNNLIGFDNCGGNSLTCIPAGH